MVPTYAIGDIQGCFATFERLLDRIQFDPRNDRLWLVGDLVNRGPGSLQMLRWAVAHDDAVTAVLGNHDLHLLARAAGLRKAKRADTLREVLAAADLPELIDWLRQRPFAVREEQFLLVHAGLLPAWTIDEAERLAAELAAALRGPDGDDVLEAMVSGPVADWDGSLRGAARWRALASAFTRLRTCRADGRPHYDFAGPPDEAPPGCVPWFNVPGRRSTDCTIVFGHWAALGVYVAPGVVATDSGCVWGGQLTAIRLPDLARVSVPAIG